MIKRLRHFLSHQFKTARDDESGVILLITVLAAATVAAGIATATLLKSTGPRPEIESNRSNGNKLEKINQAIVLHAIRDSSYLLPCPASGAAGDGVSIGACNDTTNNIGTVPWSTLGLSEDDATDAYGNQIVYAVSAGPAGACHVLDGVPTGSVNAGTVFAGDTAPGSSVLYALVSHGPNGLGSFDPSGNTSAAPTSTEESDNCAAGAGCTIPNANFIDTGPFEDDGGGASHFDDEVFLADRTDFATECQNFADMNKSELEFVEEGFGGDTVTTDLVVTNNGGGGGGASSLGNGVLTVTEDVEIETSSSLFQTDITPLYIKIDWTPTAVGTGDTVRMSIATRADASVAATLSNDIFDTTAAGAGIVTGGYTVRFAGTDDGTAGGGAITVDIMENLTSAATTVPGQTTSGSAMVDISAGDSFELEVFDDGTQIWARLTEIGDTSNQMTAYATLADSLESPNQVVFVHNPASSAASTLDNLLVAKGSVALELDNGGTLANTTTPLANFASETSFTGEGWLYLRDTAASTVDLFFVDDGISSSESRILADIANSESEFTFVDFDTTTGSLVANSQTYGTTFWRHQAFNCDSTTDRRLYAFGAALGSVDTTACDILPGTDIATATESVSFVNNTGGRILLSELRLWDAAQTTASITAGFNSRVANTSTGLDLQLHLVDGFGSSTAADDNAPAENYTVTNGRFVGFKSPFKTLASDICPGNEDTSTPPDPFKCVWDGGAGGTETSDTITLPLDITEVRIKVWGAGGGGGGAGNANFQVGGGGGFSDGRLASVGGTNIITHDLIISAGGAGQLATDRSGGGGGAGSAVEFDNNGAITLIAVAGGGGGGGAQRALATPGYGGGGTTGEVRNGGTTPALADCDGISGTQAGGGAVNPTILPLGSCGNTSTADAEAGENVNPADGVGANGGNGETQVVGPTGTGGDGGVGYGNGGKGGDRNGTANGGGGGGGYTGGSGGMRSNNTVNTVGGGGGGAGFLGSDLTSTAEGTGNADTPGGNADADRGTAATGGATAADGSPGRVVICWSSACLP